MRLCRKAADGSVTFSSVQRDAMTLTDGVCVGIRNKLSRVAEQELDE